MLRGPQPGSAINLGSHSYRGPGGSKYQPLTDWLSTQTADALPVTFGDLEAVLGFSLAPSARVHLPYWYSIQNSLGKAIAAGGYKASSVNPTAETARLIRRHLPGGGDAS
jgi:hypothetical protein